MLKVQDALTRRHTQARRTQRFSWPRACWPQVEAPQRHASPSDRRQRRCHPRRVCGVASFSLPITPRPRPRRRRRGPGVSLPTRVHLRPRSHTAGPAAARDVAGAVPLSRITADICGILLRGGMVGGATHHDTKTVITATTGVGDTPSLVILTEPRPHMG